MVLGAEGIVDYYIKGSDWHCDISVIVGYNIGGQALLYSRIG